jgi:two-component system CheB/CheR fusion protein
LATNAVKYGALSTQTGHLEISWEGTQDEIVLRWRERGGPPVTPPASRGIGLNLVHGLVEHELGGQVEVRFEPEGLECELHIPVHEPTRERDAALL